MNTSVEIKKANMNMIFDISKVLKKCWHDSYKDLINKEYLSALADEHWADFLETGLKSDSINCIVATIDSEIIGAAIFGKSITEQYPDDGEVVSLYVLQKYIGKRVGHLLFEEAQRILIERGFSDCIVCVFSENSRAIRFYEAHGFKIIVGDKSIDMGMQKLPYVIMRKDELE